MLQKLTVKDYALIGRIEVDFQQGLNIVTGETGAGKSILIGALGLLLGDRASTEIIRKNAGKSIVEGIFKVKNNLRIRSILEENQLDFADDMIVRREISLKGTNRCFVNDTPVNLQLIKQIGNILVDLHGQHEHQSLLRVETHIELLDEYAGLETDLQHYKIQMSQFLALKKSLSELRKKESLLKEKKDFYEFQLKEILNVSPEEDEDIRLDEELNILENSQRLLELSSSAYQELYESDNAVYNNLVNIKNMISELSSVDKKFSEREEILENILTQISDLSDYLRNYSAHIELEPDKLESMRQRSASINRLKKKFGGTLKAVLEYKEKISEELSITENFARRINDLQKQIETQRKITGEAAMLLSGKRSGAVSTLQKEIGDALRYLGISDPVFKVVVRQEEAKMHDDNYVRIGEQKFLLNEEGIDRVEFYISTNPGEDVKPLVKVASGGEVSRIMLALKSVLAKNDKLPLLIFDEIDTGVSGRIAQKVGKSIKALAEHHQIIAITHLPQIAGLADHHYIVEKLHDNERAATNIRELEEGERVIEIAKLLSGEEISESSIKSARELIGSDSAH